MTDILPPHSGPAEKALAGAVEASFDIPVDVATVWRPHAAPRDFLPWLAWALSVDEWSPDWPDDRKRAAISAAVMVHRHKGTLWSMRRALALAGYPSARIIEDYSSILHDGSFTHNGLRKYESSDHWAEYRVVMLQPISIVQAKQVRAILDETAPARCRLVALDFNEALNLYNGAVLHDGSYTHGVA